MTTCGPVVCTLCVLARGCSTVCSLAVGLPENHLQKLRYAVDVVEHADDPFVPNEVLDPEVLEVSARVQSRTSCIARIAQAIEWQSQRTAAEVISQREEMISQLEFADAELRKSGKQARWFHGCDEAIKALSKEVNGFLFQELLAATKYKDCEAVELFRRGAVRAVLHFILCDGQWAFGGYHVSYT